MYCYNCILMAHPKESFIHSLFTAVLVRAMDSEIDLGTHHDPALPGSKHFSSTRRNAKVPEYTCGSGNTYNLKKISASQSGRSSDRIVHTVTCEGNK